MGKTELGRLQSAIDQCNNNSGCDKYCSLERQKVCSKLIKHRERMDYCIRNNIPVERW